MNEVVDMHGRRVIKYTSPEEVKNSCFCYDCGGPATFTIIELEKFSRVWNPTIITKMLEAWFWCGECEIGG